MAQWQPWSRRRSKQLTGDVARGVGAQTAAPTGSSATKRPGRFTPTKPDMAARWPGRQRLTRARSR
jgi:hypothetical protein